MPSGHDLDNDGRVVTDYPTPTPAGLDGTPGEATDAGRAYGNDCWGFGTFPGQYGMALLVDERLEIVASQVRTFRLLPWDYMPNNLMPVAEDEGRAAVEDGPEGPGAPDDDDLPGEPGPEAWYSPEERAVVRLSSKSHWDVPVRLPGGTVLHVLCSHPTPPAFDGPEQRNVRRNHDEVRFWADYVEDASYIVDDLGRAGGLSTRERFVILGDLNCDPQDDRPPGNPVRDVVLPSPRVNAAFVPESSVAIDIGQGPLDPSDTAAWGQRVDYILPSAGVEVLRGGVWRHLSTGWSRFPSDHFPVWADLAVPQ
jgi:hypothetical protein